MQTPLKRRFPQTDMPPRRPVKKRPKTGIVSTKAWNVPRRFPLAEKVYSFKRNTPLFTVAGNVAYTPYNNATVIAFNQLSNSSDFINLFEQYRIKYVVLKFYLTIDPGAQAAGSANYPRLYWTRDTNDSTPLTTNEMYERGDMKSAILDPVRPITIGFKPNVLENIYISGVSTGYKASYDTWLDVNSSTVPYYGLKYNIDNFTNVNYRLNVDTTYYMDFKGPK